VLTLAVCWQAKKRIFKQLRLNHSELAHGAPTHDDKTKVQAKGAKVRQRKPKGGSE